MRFLWVIPMTKVILTDMMQNENQKMKLYIGKNFEFMLDIVNSFFI